ncbi:MAG: DNA topoisomerase I [Candidatus Bathyarchaeota archaeon]
MEQLIHSGVLVPKYDARGFRIYFRGEEMTLDPEQEEMAVAWVKKLGTEYAEDETFVKNFFQDFAQVVHRDGATLKDFDFSEIQHFITEDRNRKLAMSKEVRKQEAKKRKAIREMNREKYGYAVVDGVRVEVGNYMVEPSSIFMGRGQHPLRGRWKRGVKGNEVTLNLSPDAPIPSGDWKEVVWQPESMWIAKWCDNLGGKTKYVWLSDTSHIKQKRDIEKFDKARELNSRLEQVRTHILKNLNSSDPMRRKIATVCYLIDVLKFRVGDEKDKDEADTVGATTLRPEHLSFRSEGLVVFDFLGKDSVHWHLEKKLDEPVIRNIKESINDTSTPIFKGVRSNKVSAFLDEVLPRLTAKVFRTFYATNIVRAGLVNAKVSNDSDEIEKKFVATMANLEAAKTCNHKKKISKNWNKTLEKMDDSLTKYKDLLGEVKAKKTLKKAVKRRRLKALENRIKNAQIKIEIKRATRDYNLNTSLKSYIDPRTYYQWGNKIGFDWKQYYPKTLQRKFLWVEDEKEERMD